MKKLSKKSISLLLACILLTFTSIQVFASDNSINVVNTKPPIVFKADDQQLEIINKLKDANVSLGEMLEIVSPETLSQFKNKEALFLRQFNTANSEVPTGTYQGRTIHSWIAYDFMGHQNWYGTNSTTNQLSIVN